MSQIPKAIQDHLDEMRTQRQVASGRKLTDEQHKRVCQMWYRLRFAGLGMMSAEECVKAGKEQAVIEWMEAWKNGAYA